MVCANVGQIELDLHTESEVLWEWGFLGVALNCGVLRELLEKSSSKLISFIQTSPSFKSNFIWIMDRMWHFSMVVA